MEMMIETASRRRYSRRELHLLVLMLVVGATVPPFQ
jgi:hypothetical protein